MANSPITVFVPATVGNIAAGFDVLGLAVEGLGDTLSLSLEKGESQITSVTGRDANLVPKDVKKNCAAIAAESLLRRHGYNLGVHISIDRKLPISGGLGSSAAASVGGAYAAALAFTRITGTKISDTSILEAALDGEQSVAGRHLDNIAPAFFGGVCAVIKTSPPEIANISIKRPENGDWWITLVTPQAQLETKKSRAVLPLTFTREIFVQQMGYCAGLIAAFSTGNTHLAKTSLVDIVAEPHRASLIANFIEAKNSALAHGALGCSISGAGPTIFAISSTEECAQKVASAMVANFTTPPSSCHIGRLATKGAHQV